MKQSQNDLRSEEGDSGFRHGFRRLIVDRRAVGGDIGREPPSVPHDGNRGSDRDHDDGNCEEFRHVALGF